MGDHDIFTDKQCRVLDLLIEHKTSKEIARALGISPYTVDQRISLARAKLGLSSRNELAARYRVMREMPDQSPSESSASSEEKQSEADSENEVLGSPNVDLNEDLIGPRARQHVNPVAITVLAEEKIPCPTRDKVEYRVGPEMFEGNSGGLWRLGAIVATALLLVMTVLGLFAIFDQLNDLLA